MLIAYIGVLLVLLAFTKTRAAWAACAAVFLVFGIFFERRYLIYLVLGGALALVIPEVYDRVANIYYGARMNSFEWRRILWESAWNWMKWKDMPMGYGLDSFSYYSLRFLPPGLWPDRLVGPHAHSVYVQLLFETGVVGLMCGVWLYLRLLASLVKSFIYDRMRTVIVVALVVGNLVASFSDNMLAYLPFNWCFWFVIGSACAVSIAERESKANQDERTVASLNSAL